MCEGDIFGILFAGFDLAFRVCGFLEENRGDDGDDGEVFWEDGRRGAGRVVYKCPEEEV